ncbi:MAG: class I adenylate-forming enzyme family protein [Acidimicrobiales bacterium]
MTVVKQGRTGTLQPFDLTGVVRGEDGILRYTNRPSSLVEMLKRSVEADPEAEALVEVGGDRLSYREVWDRSARIAGGLRDAGVARGDRVAICLPNGVQWCLAFFGGQMAGAVDVPVNTRFSESEVKYVVNDSGAKYVFEQGAAIPDGEPMVVEDLVPTDLAAIFYTSGTTGFPKGAMTSHENFLANTETCRRVMGLQPRQSLRNLVSVPLFHVTGCNSQLLVTTELGGTTVIMPSFEVQAFLRTIVEERIDLLTSVPAVYWLAMNQPDFADVDVSAVRWLSYGGAPTPPDVVARIRQAFPNARLGNGFGLTETSSVATFLPHEYCETHAATVGISAPVIVVDLVDIDSEGVGELLIRGQNIVQGYWQKPEATAEAFTDGWLHSGDLARIDDQGFVQIVDRRKDMVNRGGENVYCVEVENALAEHPAIFEAAVVGVPDAMMGEKVGAVVVLKPGTEATGAEIADFARERIANFKVPQYVAFRSDPLPRNPGGKVLKPVLRKETEWGEPLR